MIGCISSSSGVPGIFLIQLKQVADSNFAVRIGYFGNLCRTSKHLSLALNAYPDTCAGSESQPICIPTKSQSTSQVIAQMSNRTGAAQAQTLSSATNTALLDIGLGFQNTIMYLIIFLAGICYLFSGIFLFVVKLRTKNSAAREPLAKRADLIFQRLSIGLLWLSTGLAFAAAISASQLLATLQYWPDKTLVLQAGRMLPVLQWLTVTFPLIFSAGVWRLLQNRTLGAQISGKGSFGPSAGLL